MSEVPRLDFLGDDSLHQSDQRVWTVTLNMSTVGLSHRYMVKRHLDDPDSEAIVDSDNPTVELLVIDDATGTIQITTTAPENDLLVGRCYHELITVDGSGNRLTQFTGELNFNRRLIHGT